MARWDRATVQRRPAPRQHRHRRRRRMLLRCRRRTGTTANGAALSGGGCEKQNSDGPGEDAATPPQIEARAHRTETIAAARAAAAHQVARDSKRGGLAEDGHLPASATPSCVAEQRSCERVVWASPQTLHVPPKCRAHEAVQPPHAALSSLALRATRCDASRRGS